MALPELTFTRRDWLIALAVIVLAFSYRMVIIAERATAPNELANFDPLSPGGDQNTYFQQFHGFADGTYPPDKFFYQPGLPYFLLVASKVMGTDNLGALRVFTAALAALNCGVMLAVGRLVTGERRAGILAALLLAVYPVSAFYDTDFVITSQALILTTLSLFGTLWLWRNPGAWVGAVLLGLCSGAAAVTRFEVAALGPVCGLWLIAVRRDRRTLLQVGLAAVLAAAVIAPVALHNRSGGADYLITPVGPTEIHRGNSRDAPGVYGKSNSTQNTFYDHFQYLAKDIALEPARFVQLVLYKTALFLSHHEPGNNLNFFDSGVQVSRALAWNPLNFTMLLAATIYGMARLWQNGQKLSVSLLLAAAAGFMGTVLLIWVEARLRTPVIVMMLPAAAYGVIDLADRLRRAPVAALRQSLPLFAVTGALLLAVRLGVDYLPRKVSVDALPADAVPAHVVYDGVLELVGWKTQEQYSPHNHFVPFRPYVVSLYWRLLEPVDVDYSFALKFLVDDAEMTGFDHPIGDVVYPYRTTSELDAGPIYVEHVSLSYRRFDGPFEQTGRLELVVYPERDFARAVPGVAPDGRAYPELVLGQPALTLGGGTSEAAAGEHIAFGKVLVLTGWDVPEQGRAGESITIRTGWRTTDERMTASYVIGVYLFRDGAFVCNTDGPPHDGRWLTLSIPADYQFDDVKLLQLPSEGGDYEVRVGVYSADDGARLPVANAVDDLYPIGRIRVEESVSQS